MAIPRGAVAAISFDYGHVLAGIDVPELCARLAADADRTAERAAATSAATCAAVRASMTDAYRAHDEAIGAGLGHQAGWRALMDVLVRAAGTHVDARAHARAVDRLWEAQPTRNLWRDVPPEARRLLGRLTDLRVPMVVTSNSEGRVAELVEQVGLTRHFRATLDSGLLGFAKPDRRIFALAAERLEVPLSAVVHVGDSEAADVVGARRAGAWAVRFDGFVPSSASHASEADARASTFAELGAVLAEALDVPLET